MLFGSVFSILSRESNEIAEKLIQVSKIKIPAISAHSVMISSL